MQDAAVLRAPAHLGELREEMEETGEENGPQFSEVLGSVDDEKRSKGERRAIDKVDEGHCTEADNNSLDHLG